MIADMVVRTLSNSSFDLFWLKVLAFSELLDITPQLPHSRKWPQRYVEGLAASEFHDDPKAFFRQQYFEAVDIIVNCIKGRFHQMKYLANCTEKIVTCFTIELILYT